MVVPAGMAPPALVVKVPPAEQAVLVGCRQRVYVVDGAYPDPVRVTTVPTGPADFVSVREGVVTLNKAVADEGVLAAVTRSAPCGPAVIVIEQAEKLPVGSAVHVPRTVPPAIVKPIVPGVKPVPDAVTIVPTGPLAGESFKVAATVNEATAEEGAFVAVTGSEPYGPAAIVIEHDEKLPVARAVQVPTIVPPASAKLTTPGVNPVPDAVTSLPMGPSAGESFKVAVTVKMLVDTIGPLVESFAVTAYPPHAMSGALNLHVNAPVAPTVGAPPWHATSVPPN